MALGGAVQEIVKESARELTKRGHEPVIITPNPKQGRPESIDTRVIYIGKATDPKTPLGTVAQVSVSLNSDEIEKVLEDEKFDVIHVHEPWVPLLNAQILRRRKCPVVATFHAKFPETVVADIIKAAGRAYTLGPLKYIDQLVAVSGPASEHVSSLTDREIKIIPNGIPVADLRAARSDQPLHKTKKTIVFVGRLEERKGVQYLLPAYNELRKRHDDVRLLIAGMGPDFKNLQQYVKKHNIEDVEFLGFIEHEPKLNLMANADVFVAPAVFGESFGVAPIEGLSGCGLVVAGDNPGYRSVLREVGQTSLINPKDAEQFANRLELFLYDQQFRKMFKTWAETYVEQFAYPKIIDQYEAIYERLVKDGTRQKS